MLKTQLINIRESLRLGFDNGLGVSPAYSNAIVAAAMGCELRWMSKEQGPWTPPLLKNLGDVEHLEVPDFRQNKYAQQAIKIYRFMARRMRPPISASPCLTGAPFNQAQRLRGNDIYIDMFRSPDLVQRLLEITTTAVIEWKKVQTEAAGLSISSMTAGLAEDPMCNLSPDQYRKFLFPHHERIFNTFNGGGLHSCGDYTHLLGEIAEHPRLRSIDLGVTMDVKTAREKLNRDDVIISSRIDPMRELIESNHQTIENAIKKKIQGGAGGGALSIGVEIPLPPFKTTLETYRAMLTPKLKVAVRTVRRYGIYPIRSQ